MFQNKEIKNLLAKVTEDEFLKVFQEYVKTYAIIADQPSMRDHLIRVVKIWFRIEELEKMLDILSIGTKEWDSCFKNYMNGITQWSKLLTRMGTTYTSQPYIPVGERQTQSASDMVKLTEKMDDFVKQKIKEKKELSKQRGRANPSRGRRLPKDGIPLLIKRKKKKEKEKEKEKN